MKISKIITKIPRGNISKYMGREVLGYIIQEDKVLTSESDILNSKYPIIKMVKGRLTSYNMNSFKSTFIINDTYECDFIRLYERTPEDDYSFTKAVEVVSNFIKDTEDHLKDYLNVYNKSSIRKYISGENEYVDIHLEISKNTYVKEGEKNLSEVYSIICVKNDKFVCKVDIIINNSVVEVYCQANQSNRKSLDEIVDENQIARMFAEALE